MPKAATGYFTVTVTFDRKNPVTGEAERGERMHEGVFESEAHAIEKYKPIFYQNEPTLVLKSEHFSAKKGQNIASAPKPKQKKGKK